VAAHGGGGLSVVLDASAVVAFLRAEDGWDDVAKRLSGAVLSTVTLGEAFRKLPTDAPGPVVQRLAGLGVIVKPLSAHEAWLQARVPNRTVRTVDEQAKTTTLGWGDRVAAALSLRLGLPLLTSDLGLIALGEPYQFRTFR
jgi:ribonuclease VapC